MYVASKLSMNLRLINLLDFYSNSPDCRADKVCVDNNVIKGAV